MKFIKNLVVIAGPSGAGKTILINRIKQSACNSLCEQLGLSTIMPCHFLNAIDIPNLDQSNISQMVLHYDMYSKHSENRGFEYLEDLQKYTKKLTVLTLCVLPQVLIQRNAQRLIDLQQSLLFASGSECAKLLDRHACWVKQRAYYQLPGNIQALYADWFTFIHGMGGLSHFLFDSSRPDTRQASLVTAQLLQVFAGDISTVDSVKRGAVGAVFIQPKH